MNRLDGLDDRALVLEDGWLNVLRWGSSEHRFPVSDLGETEIVRDDKKKLLGKGEERIRLRFGSIATAIWVPGQVIRRRPSLSPPTIGRFTWKS